jgi:hypothetical protein
MYRAEHSYSASHQFERCFIHVDFPVFRAPDPHRSSRREGRIMALLWCGRRHLFGSGRQRHLDGAERDRAHLRRNRSACTGKEWTSHVEFTQSAILSDISTNCKLRDVSWVIPDAVDSDHSDEVSFTGGPSWVASIVNAVGTSKCKNPDGSSYWNSTAIIVTWDDWGGWYDHEPPTIEASPQGGYQMGFRVPLIVVSAYTRAGVISNSREDFGSVIRFVEKNFGIMEGALTFADARGGTGDLAEFFSLGQRPRTFQTIKAPLSARYFLTRNPSGLPVDDD